MPIKVHCLACGLKISVRDELAGKKIKCPGCDAKVTVVSAAAKAPGTKPSKPSASRLLPGEDEFISAASIEEEEEQEEFAPVAFRPRKRTASRGKRSGRGIGANLLEWNLISLKSAGQVARIFGILNLIALIPILLYLSIPLFFFASSRFGMLGVAIAFCVLGLNLMGIKGAGGKGIAMSRDSTYEGGGSIVLGIVMICLAICGNPLVWGAIYQKYRYGSPHVSVTSPVVPRAASESSGTAGAVPIPPFGATPFPVTPDPAAERPAGASPARESATPPPGTLPAVPTDGPVAPSPGSRVLVLRFSRFNGSGHPAVAAQQALRGVTGVDSGVVYVDTASGKIAIGLAGGALSTAIVSSALERAGFEMQRGVQIGPWTP